MYRGLGKINYVLEAEKQISDASVYRGVSSREKILAKLLEASNKMFGSLRRKGFITEKQLKYFTCKYKNATNFGKLYLLPKIDKLLVDVRETCNIQLRYSYREMFRVFGSPFDKVNSERMVLY